MRERGLSLIPQGLVGEISEVVIEPQRCLRSLGRIAVADRPEDVAVEVRGPAQFGPRVAQVRR
jgi:hypothetical protein